MKHIISVLVENKFGVLTRVAGMFSGRGFNIEERRPHQDPGVPDESDRGIGLSTMTERTRIIGGRLKIESSRGSGTTVHVILPCS